MRHLVFLIVLLSLPGTLACQETEDVREGLVQILKETKHCDEFAHRGFFEETLDRLKNEEGYASYVRYHEQRLDEGIKYIRLKNRSREGWSVFAADHFLIDAKRCAWAWVSVTHYPNVNSGPMDDGIHEDSPHVSVEWLLEKIGIERGTSTNAKHGLGRFVQKMTSEKVKHSGPYQIQRVVKSVEWIDGKPPAQPKTYWSDPGSWVVAMPRPKRWKSDGRYQLYRHDGDASAPWSVAVYDTKKKRHAWVLVAGLHAVGTLRKVGDYDGLSIVVREKEERIQSVYVIEKASANAYLLKISADTGIELEGNRLKTRSHDETGVIDLELVKKAIAR